MLHAGRHARTAFGAAWLAGQVALVATAPLRPGGAFGFRMFPEGSTMRIHLEREVGGAFVPVARGEWTALDGHGIAREFSWRDRVRDPVLSSLDHWVFASYGLDAQLARLQRALDDVALHLSGDAQTTRLRADVVARRNGREPFTVMLVSHRRPGT